MWFSSFCPQDVGATGAAIRIVREDGVSDDAFFGDYYGPFANKFAPTAFGQNPKRTCL
jgi:hypothetical protein